MATNTGKGKTKKNKKTVPLANFLAEDKTAPQGFNVVNTRKLDWADSTEDDLDDTFTLNYKRTDSNKVLLPTAPKATRGPDFDMSQVPTEPPFKAYLGNLPYDVSEQEITRYFSKLNVVDVRLPTYNGRQRGFAYAEFPDRQSLYDALTMNGDSFRNRQLKVGLPGDNSSDGNRENSREERTDRTANNWRTAPREDTSSRDMNRDSYQSYNSRNGGNDSSFPDRNMQRNRSDDSGTYGRRFENDRGFKPSNDRGFDRGFDRSNNYSNDRGFDRQNDRGFDRPNNRYGNRFNDRTEGSDENRDYGYESNERSFGRRFNDSDRQTNRPFNERRDERTDNRRDYGFDRRGREDSNFETRNTSPPPQRNSEEERPKERPKLNLQPRSKPIEKTDESVAVASSAIFGGAKPVNTAAREQEIEKKLLKEKEEIDKKRETTTEERIRRVSAGSNASGNSRSRKGSDSGRDFEDNNRNGRKPRSRQTSERSTDSAPKYILARNKSESSNSSQKYVPVRPSDDRDGRDQRSYGRGNNNSNRYPNSNRRDTRKENNFKPDPYNRPPRMSNKSDEEEDPKVAYTTSNKFAHLPTEDYDEDEAPIDGHNNASD